MSRILSEEVRTTTRRGLSDGCRREPFENLETIETRHFEVEKEQIWQREFASNCVASFATKVGDRLFAVAHNMERIGDMGSGKSFPNQKNVVFSIFG